MKQHMYKGMMIDETDYLEDAEQGKRWVVYGFYKGSDAMFEVGKGFRTIEDAKRAIRAYLRRRR